MTIHTERGFPLPSELTILSNFACACSADNGHQLKLKSVLCNNLIYLGSIGNVSQQIKTIAIYAYAMEG